MNLRIPAGWDEIYLLLSGNRFGQADRHEHAAATAIVSQLQTLGVNSAVVEFPYHDHDFAAEYVSFHANLFRPGRRACTRVHFFISPSEDLDTLFEPQVPDERLRARRLRDLAHFGVYRGFCVVRPTRDASIGFTVIARPAYRNRIERTLWASYYVHILGEEFYVNGFPFLEQDARTGSCAQAALWMALRYIWAHDRGAWRSVPALTAAATSVTDEKTALSVPSGSGGIGSAAMVRAVKGSERVPHFYSAARALEGDRVIFKWKNPIDPLAIACRYLNSNIPVVLLVGHAPTRFGSFGISDGDDTETGHTLTAVGYYGDANKRLPPAVADDHLNIASWIDGLIVHDDQAGPYTNLPTTETGASEAHGRSTSGYTCADICGLIVPLPENVFLRADRAEEYAWMFLVEKAQQWGQELLRDAEDHLAFEEIDPKSLIARTFLARGYDHYQWLTRVNGHPKLLGLAAALHLPRYVWITEFYQMKDGKPDFDQTIAHVVADPTAGSDSNRTPYSAFLFGHVCGAAFAVLTTGKPGTSKFMATPLPNDYPYWSFERRIG